MENNKEDQMKNLKWAVIPFLVIGLVLTLIILQTDNKHSKEITWNNRQLPYREISGIVSSVCQNRGTITLKLKNNDVFYFSTTRNYRLNPYDFDDFVHSGDSVYKKENSMNIVIYRNNKMFEFVLEKSIGRK